MVDQEIQNVQLIVNCLSLFVVVLETIWTMSEVCAQGIGSLVAIPASSIHLKAT
jgi:hypothetical protein